MRKRSKVTLDVPSKLIFTQDTAYSIFSSLFSIYLVFLDKNTPRPFVEDLTKYGDGDYQSKQDHILLDAMGFGMGCCCLQVTFQAQSIEEARFLYDQLTPLTPIVVSIDSFD